MLFDRWRNRLLGLWSHLIGMRPRITLFMATVVAAASIVWAAIALEYQPDRNDLLSESLDWNRTFIEWQRLFPDTHALMVIVDGGAPPGGAAASQDHRDSVRRVVLALRQRLVASDDVVDATAGYPQSEFSPRTVRTLPMAQFSERLEQIEHFAAVLIGESAGASDAQRLRMLETMSAPPDAFQLLTADDRLFYIRVKPRVETGTLNKYASAVDSVRGVLAEFRREHPGCAFGVTGIPVIEMDETQVATMDASKASIAAMVLIVLLLVTAFHSWRTPLLLAVSLLFGIAWSFGYLTLRIGHLQVISVVFTVMLMGLGIDFGIHLATNLELVRHKRGKGVGGFIAAMRETIETAGPGIITGAVTTAAAFGTTLFTKFRGVAEMGEIAGAGVLLCLLAMFTVFPALLRLGKHKRGHIIRMEDRFIHFFEERWIMPFVRRPRLTLAVAGVVTAASLAAAAQIGFDFDLLKLFPQRVESVQWQKRLADAGRPTYFGVSMPASLAKASEHAAAFRKLSTVSDLGGIGWLFPRDERRKLEMLGALRGRYGPALRRITEAPADVESASPLARALAQLRVKGAQRILDALDPSPLTPDDFPAAMLAPYIHRDEQGRIGRVVIEVYPDVPPGVDSALSPRYLPQYVTHMASIDPEVTGTAPQIYRSGVLIRESYQIAALFAMMIVLIIVYIDFLSLSDALLSLVPVAVGFAATFGLMYLLGMSINAANVIVLPLMFGIGVDAGVHVIHRYRQEPDARPPGLTSGTGKGITVTSLATMIGFGSLLLADHRGLAGLGFVLTVGIGLTTLACWTVMPAWLELRTQRRQRKQQTIVKPDAQPAAET